jgi:uncharacterized protein (TIGR03492 family)
VSVRVTFLSNGHGEDVIGARLARELLALRPEVEVAAFPTVDQGEAYDSLDVPVLGPRKVMPSGGMTLHSASNFRQDLQAGFLGMTLRQLRELRGHRTEVLVVVGDVYALALANLVRARERFVFQPLVSVRHHEGRVTRASRLFMERFTPLEQGLMRRAARHVYTRDAVTAAYLRSRGVRHVSFLGNPVVDAVAHVSDEFRVDALGLKPPRVALLPGSRAHATKSFGMMLEALRSWPEVTGMVAWAGPSLPERTAEGWRLEPPDHAVSSLLGCYRHGQQRVLVFDAPCFAGVLHHADLVLGTAGTANEQAAARGLPVVSFPVPPLYTRAFLDNQQRLLSHALTLSEADPESIAQTLQTLWQDRAWYALASQTGVERMGPAGGTRAIIKDILVRSSFLSAR